MMLASSIRWNPFFSGLDDDQIAHIAKASRKMDVESGYEFFHEGEEIDAFYLVKEGTVSLTMGIPDREKKHTFVNQLTRNMDMEEIEVNTITEGQIFGWSALISPHISTASAVATTPCMVIAIDCVQLRQIFEKDHAFACLMTLKAAQTIRDRLRSMRIETIAFTSM